MVRGDKSFSSGMSLYAVADGHNGSVVARHVGLMLPDELERQLGSGAAAADDAAVRQALARTFVATDAAVCQQFQQAGGWRPLLARVHVAAEGTVL